MRKFIVTMRPWGEGPQEIVKASRWDIQSGALVFHDASGFRLLSYAPGHWGHVCEAEE